MYVFCWIQLFYDFILDDSIPTIDLGIPNTHRGHCEKTLTIIKYLNEEIEKRTIKISWIAIVDDDTILR